MVRDALRLVVGRLPHFVAFPQTKLARQVALELVVQLLALLVEVEDFVACNDRRIDSHYSSCNRGPIIED